MPHHHASSHREAQSLDVAIIGAGVSGLYAGWRLKTDPTDPAIWQDSQNRRVAIFEMSDRVGGRLFSVTDLPGMPNVVAELGGMRFMEHQRIAQSLITTLGLTAIDFPMGDESRNLFYLRGQRFTADKWTEPGFTTRYFMNEEDYGKTPDDLFAQIVNNVLIANQSLLDEHGITIPVEGRDKWDIIKPLLRYYRGPDNGQRLENMGFWNLILDQLGNEGYELVAQGGGYYSNTINWNAAEALPYVVGDFGSDVVYKTIQNGFDQIAKGLENAFLTAGGAIHTQQMLINFRHTPSTDPNASTYRYQLIMRNTGDLQEYTVYTNRIILAMPRRSLELLSQDNFFFDNGTNLNLLSNVRSVIGEPSFKLLMGFYEEGQDLPWWTRSHGLTSGRSITDLPMRQCYYFATDPITKHSLLLASYNDMSTVDYWKPLENPNSSLLKFRNSPQFLRARESESFQPRATPAASLEALYRASQRYSQAPARMAAHSLEQLKMLHGLPSIPDPYTTAYMNWNDDPFGGGYHAWKATYGVGDVMRAMRKPLPSEQVHICGEAYSDQQGWVEGAFCIAELMLQEHFGMSTPAWLTPQDYYLGR